MRHTIVLIGAVLLVLFVGVSYAQGSDNNSSVNLDRQPIWGPTGYDHVEYYYLPDIESYYYVPQHKFFFFNNGRWNRSSSLPSRYRGYNLYNSYKVVVNEPKPYLNNLTYKNKYSSYKDRHDQESIRDSRDPKYFAHPKHPEHKNWLKQQKQEKQKQHDNNKGNNSKRK